VTIEFGHQGPAYGKRHKSIIKQLNKLNATRSFICIKYAQNEYQIIINWQSQSPAIQFNIYT